MQIYRIIFLLCMISTPLIAAQKPAAQPLQRSLSREVRSCIKKDNIVSLKHFLDTLRRTRHPERVTEFLNTSRSNNGSTLMHVIGRYAASILSSAAIKKTSGVPCINESALTDDQKSMMHIMAHLIHGGGDMTRANALGERPGDYMPPLVVQHVQKRAQVLRNEDLGRKKPREYSAYLQELVNDNGWAPINGGIPTVQ